ncbi:MAG: TetR family transcriptional regulator, partial [Nocardioides sp.]|nr:TetR family transcriptional regulator [Nocardioides sp.]
MTETRGERKERTRRAILDAALALCEESSLVALSLRQVAKEVGVVPTAFYRHFDSIEALGLALVDESFVSLREMLLDVRRSNPGLDHTIDSSIGILV